MGKIYLFFALQFALVFHCAWGKTFLECSCSASRRGYRTGVLTELTQSRAALLEYANDQWSKLGKKPPAEVTKRVQGEIDAKAIDLWKACLSNWKHEECVNADTRLRICKGNNCEPNSFCKYQAWNWVNVRAGKPAAGCDTSKVLRSEDPGIIAGRPEAPTLVRPSNSPSPSPSKKVAIAIPTNDVNTVPNPNRPNVNNNGTAVRPLAPTVTPNVSGTPFPVAVGLSPGPDAVEPTKVNEGCVAVEHLQGYVLQHREHLLRNVLCANKFCATPNHAIIVDGEWTSMKLLCKSTWNCVRTVKLVNNLKVTANRRAVISDSIIATPYDLRFPRWGVWLLQIVEIAFNAVGLSGILAGVFAFAAVMYKSQKQYQ